MSLENLKLNWVLRKDINDIIKSIRSSAQSLDNKVHIFLINGGPGAGKTVAARLIGQEFNSPDGYESGKDSGVLWIGLQDMFDPDTNSNQGLEQSIQSAYEKQNIYFTKYEQEQDFYKTHYQTGARGTGLEKQRQLIEQAFAYDLGEASTRLYPIIPLDTIERLASATDPIQRELELSDDTSSVLGWLMFQIEKLPRGSVLLFGRSTELIPNLIRQRFSADPRIHILQIELESFDTQDIAEFFEKRKAMFPSLKILKEIDKNYIVEKTNKNPLLMDIALQAILESQNFQETLEVLKNDDNLTTLQEELLNSYFQSFTNPYRHTIFNYLAIARNGLFENLLKFLEADANEETIQGLLLELSEMEKLPFVKVRNIYVNVAGEQTKKTRKTYFLHDEMYLSFDRKTKSSELFRDVSKKITDWYEFESKRITGEADQSEIGLTRSDLFVESLIYRLRSDCKKGYLWYLLQEDQAIRNALSLGLDMRLRDGMGQFMTLAGIVGSEKNLNLTSPIDKEFLEIYPELPDEYIIDSGMLWIKRLSVRGNHKKAIEIGSTLLEKIKNQANRFSTLALAEFYLWLGQAQMYSGKNTEAKNNYIKCIQLTKVDIEKEQSNEYITRLGVIAGRANNNLGYLFWINEGRYRLAISHFEEANNWYQLALEKTDEADEFEAILKEEIANTQDNLGRVYSLLGYHPLAEDAIREGLLAREKLGLPYRRALSLVSMATALNASGQLRKAQKTSGDAIQAFRKIENEARPSRGIGISLITKGAISRNIADQWREEGLDITDALEQIEYASTDLNTSVNIFRDSVNEPVRLIDAYNELGCCKRAEYLIRSQDPGTSTKTLSNITRDGANYFTRAIDLAKSIGHIVEAADSMQDLAVLYFRAKQFEDATKWLNLLESEIPDEYKIQEGRGLSVFPKDVSIDAFYKLLGQTEMLRGTIVFEMDLTKNKKEQGSEKNLVVEFETYQKTIKHYVFASEYFTHYSTETYSIQRTHGRMKSRLRHCKREWSQHLANNYIPQIAEEYKLWPQHIKRLLAHVFGIIE